MTKVRIGAIRDGWVEVTINGKKKWMSEISQEDF